MYAIIETGGKQLKVEVGQEVFVEKLEVSQDDIHTFDKVLLISDKDLKIGNPYLVGATVTAKVLKQGKGKKLVIYKYKNKNGSSHRKQGHRQPYTKLVIEKIAVKEAKKTEAVETPAESSPKEVSKKEAVKKETTTKTTAKSKKDDTNKDA